MDPDANYTTIYYPYTCECNASTTYGIINAGETYEVGGLWGWFYWFAQPDFYPFADLHISVGDKIWFKMDFGFAQDNVWLITEEQYNTCDFSDLSNSFQLAVADELNCADTSPGYPDNCGYKFLLQDWHQKARGISFIFFVDKCL